jgi:hypothetical protein
MKNEKWYDGIIINVKSWAIEGNFSFLISHFSLKYSTFAAAFEEAAASDDGCAASERCISLTN